MRSTRIIIVNYRTPGLVVDCLRSLDAEVRSEPNCRAIVVDNASADGSVEYIGAAIETVGWTWAEILPLNHNGGFAFGNNAAIRPLLRSANPPNYIHLLNPDTYIRPGAVSKLIDFMEAHPRIGIAGSRLENPDGSPQCSAFHFHGILSELERGLRLGIASKVLKRWMVAPPPGNVPSKTDWVNGASMTVRREVFDSIGPFDEGYFLYFEETDFCKRAKNMGWPSWTVPQSRVVHLEGQSTGVTGIAATRNRLPAYWFDSRRRYYRKHHGTGYEFAANFVHLAAYATWRFRKWAQGKSDRDARNYFRDFLRNMNQ